MANSDLVVKVQATIVDNRNREDSHKSLPKAPSVPQAILEAKKEQLSKEQEEEKVPPVTLPTVQEAKEEPVDPSSKKSVP